MYHSDVSADSIDTVSTRRRFLRGALSLGLFSLVPCSALSNPDDTVSFDIVVIGAGGAGLAAALAAAQKGVSVLVLEKMPMLGGNTFLAAGHLLSAKSQTPQETENNEKDIVEDILLEGRGYADLQRVREIVKESSDVVTWLQNNGANIEKHNLTPLSIGSQYRPLGHTPIGQELVQTLLHGLENKQVLIKILSNVRQILIDDHGRVTGVRISRPDGSTWQANASSIVLATGGYSANDAMIEQYAPQYTDYLTTNAPGATGDGIQMGRELGADIVDLDSIVVHPTTMPFSGLILPRSARVNGGILLSDQGKRFTNELSRTVAADIHSKSHGSAWLILDQQCIDEAPPLQNYVRTGYLTKANNTEELSRIMRLPVSTLTQELVRYADYCANGQDPEFHRRSLTNDLTHFPLYVVRVQPGVHYTAGGIRTDQFCRVLSNGHPIPGLYAAGETVGGIFGRSRPEGTGLMLAMVSGRMAGEEAAKFALENPSPAIQKNRRP